MSQITYSQENFGEIYIFILKAQYHHAFFKAYFFLLEDLPNVCVCQIKYVTVDLHSFIQSGMLGFKLSKRKENKAKLTKN